MGIYATDKIKSLLNQWEPNTVVTNERLKELGITPQLVQKYLTNDWLERVGVGALKRPNETLSWQSCLYSLQTQLGVQVHVGALSALESEGYNHYLRLSASKVYLFSEPGVTLPKWYKDYPWGVDLEHVQTKLFPSDLGVTDSLMDGFRLRASSPERAILELLHLAPQRFDLLEASQIVESLRTLRPSLLQKLLENCNSIKVTRLFLHLAERAKLPVFSHLDVTKFDLGTGARALVKDGAYVAKYHLVLPTELVTHGN